MKIEAAVAKAGRPDLALARLDLAGPGPGEVLVRIVAAGICHTDVKAADPGSAVPGPVVLGHEGAGIVEAVGPGVTKVVPGDHVVLTFAYCGHCRACLEAAPAYCHRQWPLNFGCQRANGEGPYLADEAGKPVQGSFFGQSSFASHAIATERNTVKVPRDVPLELLGPLGCGIQSGAGAVLNEFRLRPGQSIAVYGVGSLGLSAVMAARLAGAGRIVAIDRHAHRLDLARELGADALVEAGDGPVTPAVMKATPDGEGVDFVLDTTGALQVMHQAIDVLAPRGTIGFVTSPWSGEELGVAVQKLLLGRKIRGIVEGNSVPDIFIPRLIELYRKGLFPFDRLVRFYPFAEINRAIHDSETGETVKPVVKMAA
ncbi:MAG TPA: NAD(P)-dependent alcohol dehydrogenase [Hyphomicrobiales bacterium]|nr:NAD(P)-dependent alcohol dehydrogenase [Hyphomicrobiales bacterium]